MEIDESRILLNEINKIFLETSEYPQYPALLYAKLDSNMVSLSIFTDLGNHIVYHPGRHRLSYMLLDLWELCDPEKPWAEIEYVIRDCRFEVAFIYPEEIDANVDSFDRRDRIVAKYFGEKPIEYPPWPEIQGHSFDL